MWTGDAMVSYKSYLCSESKETYQVDWRDEGTHHDDLDTATYVHFNTFGAIAESTTCYSRGVKLEHGWSQTIQKLQFSKKDYASWEFLSIHLFMRLPGLKLQLKLLKALEREDEW